VIRVCKSKEKKKNLKFGGGVKGAITTNRGFVHLNKKPQNGLETLGKGYEGRHKHTKPPKNCSHK
jgi:hypothetical protein